MTDLQKTPAKGSLHSFSDLLQKTTENGKIYTYVCKSKQTICPFLWRIGTAIMWHMNTHTPKLPILHLPHLHVLLHLPHLHLAQLVFHLLNLCREEIVTDSASFKLRWCNYNYTFSNCASASKPYIQNSWLPTWKQICCWKISCRMSNSYCCCCWKMLYWRRRSSCCCCCCCYWKIL